MSHYLVKTSEKEFDVKVDAVGDSYAVTVNGRKKAVIAESLGGSRLLLLIDQHPSEVDIRSDGYESRRLVFIKGTEIEAEIEDFRLAQAKKVAGMKSDAVEIKSVKAPMPGLILELKVSAGEKVRQQQQLIIIEAMKMENIIKSPVYGVIKKVFVTPGKSVEKNDLLIEFE